MTSREHSDDGLGSATVVDDNGHDFPIGGDNGLLGAGEEVGEYIVDAPIGKGGMGVVYRATHKIIGKSAAVKVLHRAAGERQAKRLVAEARAVNQICHDNIVDVFDFGVLHDGRPYVVMELLVGRPLDTCLVPGEPMSVVDALRIVAPVASALQAAHSQGIVHRDLKPANIYLHDDEGGLPKVKLLDFGIAKFLDSESNQGLTTEGMVLGTLLYIAPEIASGKEVSVRADTYSLGVMLYQMLVGSLPFSGENSLETLYAHVHTPPPTPTEKHIKLPPSLESLLLRMLAKKPKDRPSLTEVEKYARQYKDGSESVQFHSPLRLLSTRSPAPRRKWMIGLGVGALVLGVAALLIVGSGSDPQEAQPSEGALQESDKADVTQESAAAPEGESEGQAASNESGEPHTELEAAAAADDEETMEFDAAEAEQNLAKQDQANKRNKRRRARKKKKGKGKAKPADDAPIDPLRGMR